jgi:hypothetical protein
MTCRSHCLMIRSGRAWVAFSIIRKGFWKRICVFWKAGEIDTGMKVFCYYWQSLPGMLPRRSGGPDFEAAEADVFPLEPVPEWAGSYWAAWAGALRKGSSGPTDGVAAVSTTCKVASWKGL